MNIIDFNRARELVDERDRIIHQSKWMINFLKKADAENRGAHFTLLMQRVGDEARTIVAGNEYDLRAFLPCSDFIRFLSTCLSIKAQEVDDIDKQLRELGLEL